MSAVLGMASRSAAGDEDGLWALLQAGGHAVSDSPPYPTDRLSNLRVGLATTDRMWPARTLLLDVVTRALGVLPRAGTGLIVGTSSGNLTGPWERWHVAHRAGEAVSEAGTGRDDTALQVAAALELSGPVATLSTACTSGTAILAIAQGWLADGLCERVVCAGVDAASLFVHGGFSALGALASDLCRPFADDRDGLVLGDGAAAIVLGDGSGPFLRGVGLSCDGIHLTAPDRTGGGLARAIQQAHQRAGAVPRVLSAHGTGTVFNDAMEEQALSRVYGDALPGVYTVKQAIGHTTGAAGTIEAVVALQRLSRGPLPTVLGQDPGPVDVTGTQSAAFGGMNAAAVFGTEPGPAMMWRDVYCNEPVTIEVSATSEHWEDPPVAVTRSDAYSRGVLVALHRVYPDGVPSDVALVLSTRQGCRIQDLRHHARWLDGRPSPRAFAATIPGYPLAQAAVLWGLTGPMLCFVGDVDPVAEARRLVGYGWADRAVALTCDAPEADGPATVSARVVCVRDHAAL